MRNLNVSRRLWLSRIAGLLGGLLCLGGRGSDAAAVAAAGPLDAIVPVEEASYSYCDGEEEVESVTTFEYDELGRLTRVTVERMKDEG